MTKFIFWHPLGPLLRLWVHRGTADIYLIVYGPRSNIDLQIYCSIQVAEIRGEDSLKQLEVCPTECSLLSVEGNEEEGDQVALNADNFSELQVINNTGAGRS